jgi:hypothetical protein
MPPTGVEGRQVSTPKNLGFGGFLVGLGAGWLAFRELEVTGNVFAWIMIIGGCAVVASSLLNRWNGRWRLGRLVGGAVGGLIFALFITSGFVLFGVSSSDYNGSYRAEETRDFSGSVTAGSILLDINNFNGPIKVTTWARNEYSISVLVKAKGSTVAEAERNLNSYDPDLEESVLGGRLRLVYRHNVAPTRTSLYSVQVEAILPEDAVIDLDLDSSNGGIHLGGIEGGTLELDTSNGGVVFDDVWARVIEASTSNSAVTGTVEAPDTTIRTSNGAINLNLPCTETGRYVLRTSNGFVGLEVSQSNDVGFDLALSTSNARIDLNLPDLEYSEDQRASKEARTRDFGSKAVKITIDASTSNGAMEVDN